jgi:hypothetical protein
MSGKAVRLAALSAALAGAWLAVSAGCAGAAAPAGKTGLSPREESIAELKALFARKEKELASLRSERMRKLAKAEPLSKRVQDRKEGENRGVLDSMSGEKDMARLRAMLQEIEKLSASEEQARTDAWACSGAIVEELEALLDEVLARGEAAGRPGLRERVRELERERRYYQGRMNALTPSLRVPRDVPRTAAWTDEMREDLKHAAEAGIARLQDEKAQYLQEKRLREQLIKAVPEAVDEKDREGLRKIETRIAELDREIEGYRRKLELMKAGGTEKR